MGTGVLPPTIQLPSRFQQQYLSDITALSLSCHLVAYGLESRFLIRKDKEEKEKRIGV